MTYAQEKQLVSAEAFIAKIDSLIEAYGGTPTEVELSPSALKSEASFRHQITDELFQAKINQLVTAMGGTPSAIVPTSGNGFAALHGYVDGATFEDKMAEVAANAGGGGSLRLIPVTITNNTGSTLQGAYFDENGEYSTRSGVLGGYVPLTNQGHLESPVGFFQAGRKLGTISATATDDNGSLIRCMVGQFDFSNSSVFGVFLYFNGSFSGTQISLTLSV